MPDSIVHCLIVDDEPIAREIIENYCVHLPRLKVIASPDNAIEAKAILQKEQIDLLFLDINMPVLDGISLIRTLKQYPRLFLPRHTKNMLSKHLIYRPVITCSNHFLWIDSSSRSTKYWRKSCLSAIPCRLTR